MAPLAVLHMLAAFDAGGSGRWEDVSFFCDAREKKKKSISSEVTTFILLKKKEGKKMSFSAFVYFMFKVQAGKKKTVRLRATLLIGKNDFSQTVKI